MFHWYRASNQNIVQMYCFTYKLNHITVLKDEVCFTVNNFEYSENIGQLNIG